jgi:hypothetical protein
MNTLYSSEGIKIKCHLGHCEHKTEVMGDNTHDEGLCWKITQEEFKDQPTNAKYCPCQKDSRLIRTYARVGYIERDEHDQMIPRKCATCPEICLFTINEQRCLACRTMDCIVPDEVTI